LRATWRISPNGLTNLRKRSNKKSDDHMPARSSIIAVATMGEQGLEDRISSHFGRSKVFTVIEIENGEVKNVQVVQNPAASLSRGIGRTVARHLASMGVCTVISGELGLGASTALNELRMKKLVVTPGQRVIDVLRKNDMVSQKESR